jgi:hypothetical protein
MFTTYRFFFNLGGGSTDLETNMAEILNEV